MKLLAWIALLLAGIHVALAQETPAQSMLDGTAFGKELSARTHAQSVNAGAAAFVKSMQPASAPAQACAGQDAGKEMLRASQDAQKSNMNALSQAVAQSQVGNGAALLTDTLHGMPVLPPGMTLQQASQYVSHDWPRKREKTAHLFVLVSLGMPKAVLKNLFDQVASSPALQNETVFVLRGWGSEPQGFQRTVSELERLQPHGQYKAPVFVDPSWFESLHVTRVPAIVVANTAHNGMILGDGLSLLDARNRIAHAVDLSRAFGKTWAITEPDALKMIQDAARKVDLQKWQEKAKAGMWKNLAKNAPALPESAADMASTFDPSIIATRDVTLPDGRVVIHAGQRINPLDEPMPWGTLRYIIFDAQKPWQVAQARQWARQYPNARILMAGPPTTERGWIDIEHAFGGTPVRLIEPLIAQRLGVTYAPAMVWPQGDVLKVFVKGVPRKEQ